MCAYLMISLNTQTFLALNSTILDNSKTTQRAINFSSHPQWNHQTGWKNSLNNIRLLVQPSFILWLIFPLLEILDNSSFLLELHGLIDSINQFKTLPLSG